MARGVRATRYLILLSLVLCLGADEPGRPDYPDTHAGAVVDTLHGRRIADPYRWLENGDDPLVQAWSAAQHALTRKLLDARSAEQEYFARRLAALFAPSVRSTPRAYGQRYFFTKREGSSEHPVLYVSEGSVAAKPRVVVNPNEFSADGTVAMDWWYPSPDGALLAYGRSAGGTEKSTLYVRNVATGEDLDLQIPHTRFAVVAWDADGRGFTYTRYPAPAADAPETGNYHRHIYHHRLGTDWQTDPKIWGAGKPKESMADVTNSSDDRYQFLTVHFGWARNELYVRAAGATGFRPVAVDLPGLFVGDVHGATLYLWTNHEAPRYRVVAAPVDEPGPANWTDVVPQQQGVISGFVIADGKLIVHVMENAYSRLLIHELDGKRIKEIELPGLGSVSGLSGRPDSRHLLFTFESFAQPPVVFHYDLREHTREVLDRLEPGVDLSPYETRQVWFNSADGTRVPMFVTQRKNLALDGNNPAVLYGYGGFNISLTPEFRRDVIPWLERGGVWAVANIRGGGEFGRAWHLAAQREKKQNAFDDFIAAAEKLIADGYTSAARLAATGESNGGLLTGAMIVQRPDLFRAVHCGVPLLDMLRYHKFEIARLWIPEYGTAEHAAEFEYLHAYSPYHHVEPGVAYPAVLFTTAAGDTRVDAMHARKMAAALQAATSSPRPILLRVAAQVGHGAGKPLSRLIDERVDLWTFFAWQLGLPAGGPQTKPATQPTHSNDQ